MELSLKRKLDRACAHVISSSWCVIVDDGGERGQNKMTVLQRSNSVWLAAVSAFFFLSFFIFPSSSPLEAPWIVSAATD